MFRHTLKYLQQSQRQSRSLQHSNSILRQMIMLRNFAQVDIKLPDLGEGTKEATLKEWYVKVGDQVEEFEDLCEVFTDKLVAKIPSTATGKVVALHYEIDDMPQTGHVLLQIETDGDAAEAAEPDLSSASSSSPEPAQESKPSGKTVKDKVATAPPGKLSGKALSTPAVRFMAKKEGIDISRVPGTGRNGRVTKADLLAFIKGGSGTAADGVAPPTGARAGIPKIAPLYGVTGDDTVKKITGISKAMTKTMTESLSIPQFTFSDEMDATNLMALRQEMKQVHPGLTMLPFFIKACSIALLEFPVMNSHIDNEPDSEGYIQQFVIKKAHNFSVAMDTKDGLIVPNVKHVEDKSILGINGDILALRDKANAGALLAEDFADGTFSISSVGNIGGTYASPVVLRPQAAIIAIGKARKYAKYVEDASQEAGHRWEPSDSIAFSISADHRIIDGATCARFAAKMKLLIEQPNLMLLNMH